MKNTNKKLIVVSLAILGLTFISVILFLLLRDPNSLTAKEKKWIKDNKNVLTDIRITNDVNTFGKSGEGVFFDYLNDFKEEYKLDINILTYSYGSVTPGIAFKVDNVISPNDILFYEDHYVLVSKKEIIINDLKELTNKKIGVTNSDLAHISYYFNQEGTTLEQYASIEALVNSFESLDFIILPLNVSLEFILQNNYQITYHFSDIKQFYYLKTENNPILNSILTKYYNNWSKKNYEDSYYSHLFNTFMAGLNLGEADIHTLTSKEYKYGLVTNSPYEINSGNNYGGIISEYINSFKKMADIDVKFIKYHSYENLNKVANNNKLDFYFSYVNLNNKFTPIASGIHQEFAVVGLNTNKTVINSLESLKGKTVYVLNNSILKEYIQSLNIATVKSYNDISNAYEIIKKDNIVIMDSQTFDYNNNRNYKNTVAKYRGKVKNLELTFRSNLDSTFNNLFKSYVNFIDYNLVKNTGISSYNNVLATSSIFNSIFKYLLYILVVVFIIAIVVLQYTKKIKISTRIKKDSKMKYFDYLTNLKNRNYLNENIEKWNQNSIYPQTIIIIDLNNIKYINDTYGHEEGDNQIKAAANILIKNQLDNSEIIRTDGNEFLIYLVEYNDKQISNYIHKLYKEFKTLPYEYGVALGYSVINDDLKLVDDAINEASLDMRTNKQNGVKDVEKA